MLCPSDHGRNGPQPDMTGLFEDLISDREQFVWHV